MSDEAIKPGPKDRTENSHQIESAKPTSKLLEEFLSNPSTNKHAAWPDAAGTIPALDKSQAQPLPDWFPPIGKIPASDSKPQIYIPSPSEIAPIELPAFFDKYPKSPELDKVGQAADKLAQLMKANASPEDQQKAWQSFEDSAKGVSGKLAALRLEESFYLQKVPGALGVEFNSYTGKLRVVDYGDYKPMGEVPYKEPDLKSLNSNADKDPAVVQASSEFAEKLQKGVTSDELKQMLPELLDKLASAGMDSADASSTIYWALAHAPNNKYNNGFSDLEPVIMLDGKPVHIYTSALWFDKSVKFGFTPAEKAVFD